MATQPNARLENQSDRRTRIDGSGRETVSTHSSGQTSPVQTDTRVQLDRIRDLIDRLIESAQTLLHSAESIESRGLKLLLKVMAQERVYMLEQLRASMGLLPVDPLDGQDPNNALPTSIAQGLKDIQSAMTVKRQGREDLARKDFVAEEEKLLEAYSAVLETDVPGALRRELEAQRAQIAQLYARLSTVTKGDEPIVARVFDSRDKGDAAIARLKTGGLTAEQIDAVTINRLARELDPRLVTPPNRKSPAMAGALAGGIIGAVIGLALALFVSMAPQLVGWVTVGPVSLFIAATLIGAVFGLVFGFLIGQSRREDDVAVTVDSLINGEILVVAYPTHSQVPMVEDILEVQHARELRS